jgi:ADP-ribose pyrophosphatase YjhB (NUDIX family)
VTGPTPQSVHLSSVGILLERDRLLMVESSFPGRSETYWTLPGGIVEGQETVADALVREFAEETGLKIEPNLALVAVIQLITARDAPDSVTFVMRVKKWRGDLSPDDPDRVTKRAEFVHLSEAVSRLEDLPWGLSAPIVRHLIENKDSPAVWTYEWDGIGPYEEPIRARLVRGPLHNVPGSP